MEISVQTKWDGHEVWIRETGRQAHPIEIRIGDPTSTGSRYTALSTSQARQLGHLLLAAAEEPNE